MFRQCLGDQESWDKDQSQKQWLITLVVFIASCSEAESFTIVEMAKHIKTWIASMGDEGDGYKCTADVQYIHLMARIKWESISYKMNRIHT